MSSDSKKSKAEKAKAATEILETTENETTEDGIVPGRVETIEETGTESDRAADEKSAAGPEIVREGESEVQTDVRVEQTSKRDSKVKAAAETDSAPHQAEVPVPKDSGLKPVSAWAAAKRLASWRSAALLRAMGWADDKQVSEAEFADALAGSLNRRQGGHR